MPGRWHKLGSFKSCCWRATVLTPPADLLATQTVALDPRYSERKTREFVHGSQSGTLTLISKVIVRYLY